MTLNRLVFFGNERLATAVHTDVPVLRALIEAGYDMKAVVANHAEARSRNKRPLEIAQTAQAFNIPLMLPEKPISIIEDLKDLNAEAAVLVAYGRIIPQQIIDIFPHGIINIHPSLLPKYRGPTPIESVILNGEHETGVSLMSLSAQMDAGAIYAQRTLSLNGSETKQQLSEKLTGIGKELLINNLPSILDGSLLPQPQDEAGVTYSKLLNKSDGQISWDAPAELIERKIRAYAGFPRARAEVFGQSIIITRASVIDMSDDSKLIIKCSTGFLEIERLIAPSGKEITGAEFLRGYRR